LCQSAPNRSPGKIDDWLDSMEIREEEVEESEFHPSQEEENGRISLRDKKKL